MDSLQGKLLLAAPALVDPNFARSVVLIVRHDEQGAMGLVLNRPTGVKVREAVVPDGGWSCTTEAELLRGGPCDGPLMVLHNHAQLAQETVLAGVYFTVDSDLVKELLSQEVDEARFFHGYAGWAAGQLEGELAAGGWVVMDATEQIVFQPDMDTETWAALLKQHNRDELKSRINPNLIPPDPSVN
ncbi:MAG: YqgE/AlgH family protein [Phycisphaeraceae bacterium]